MEQIAEKHKALIGGMLKIYDNLIAVRISLLARCSDVQPIRNLCPYSQTYLEHPLLPDWENRYFDFFKQSAGDRAD